MPGAVDFTNYAKSKNIEVFYVSNREEDESEATILNLKNENFPFADKDHIYFKIDKESSKVPRFNLVAQKYQVLLFIGDNLRDYDDIFANRIENYGFNQVDSLKNLFGDKFIILPNPMYGEWEKAVFGSKKLSDESERNKMKKQAVNSY